MEKYSDVCLHSSGTDNVLDAPFLQVSHHTDSTVSESLYSDYVHYLTKSTKIPNIVRNFLFIYLAFQLLVVGYIPVNNSYWSKCPSTQKIVELLSYISLILSLDINSTSFVPCFATLGAFFLFDIIISYLIKLLYSKYRYINPYICSISRYPSLINSTFLFPITCAYCGRYLNFSFYIQSDESTAIYAILTVIYLIFSVYRTIYFLLTIHYTVSFHDTLFHIWKPLAIVRLYLSLGLMVFFMHIMPQELTSFPIRSLILTLISAINCYFECFQTNWAQEFQSSTLIVVMSTATLSSLAILIDIVVEDGEHLKEVFWASLFLMMIIILLVQPLNTILSRRALKRLKDPLFPEKVKTARQAHHDLCIGTRHGQKDVLMCNHIQRVIERFPDSFDIYLFLARLSLAFGTSPITMEEIATKFEPGPEYNPISKHVYISITRVLSPTNPVEFEVYNKLVVAINRNIASLIDHTRTLYNLILNELTRSLPKASLQFDKVYSKTVRLLFNFVQRYPTSPDGQFFLEMLELLSPDAPELPELKKWQNYKPDYIKMDMTLFPSHLSTLLDTPEIFRSYTPKYSNEKTQIAEGLLDFETYQTKNAQSFSHVREPYKHVMSRWFIKIITIVALLLPCFLIPVMIAQNQKFYSRTNHIMNGYSIISKIYRMNAFLYPVLFFKNCSLNNDSTFWDNFVNYSVFRNYLMRSITALQMDLLQYSAGYGSNMTIDLDLLKLTSELFHRTDPNNKNYTYYKVFMTQTFIADDFISDDYVYLLYDPDIPYGITVLNKMLTTVSSISDIIFRNLTQVEIFTDGPFPFDPIYLTILMIALLVVAFILIFFSFKSAIQRFDLFFFTLRETSKAAITRVLNDFQKCLRLISTTGSARKKRKKAHVFNFTVHFAIPVFVFFALLVIFIGLSQGYYGCVITQLDNIHKTYKNFSITYIQSSNLIIRFFEYALLNMTDVKGDIKNTIVNFSLSDWIIQDYQNSMCPACSKRDVYLSYTSKNNSVRIDTAFYNWFAYVSHAVDLNKTNPNVDEIVTDVIIQYFSDIDPLCRDSIKILETTNQKDVTYTLKHQITIVVLYFIVSMFFVAYLAEIIKFADKPFSVIVRLLGRLPENALSPDTMKILNEHSWDFEIKKFNFDPMYYEQVLKTLPDPVIVIDKMMDIIYFNKSARLIISMPTENSDGEEISEHSELTKRKLFDAKAIDLRALPEEEGQEEASMPEFCDIVEEYLLDDRNTILTRKLGAQVQRVYYSFSIQPLEIGNPENVGSTKAAEHFALIFKNIGEEIRQQKMLEEEAVKHFNIVNQILPAEIARRLLHEQHSISFRVDKVAISYCDIVSFTPWCGSQKPEDVVETLNCMFTSFDGICSKYDQVTKIKCIGDCYMSASGIFSQDKQPDIAAKQMVCFCLDLIDAIGDVNHIRNTNLQVRIGSAFGGPISAGVMGMHKPVFDIWGKIVNDANFMESSGSPMTVHITDELYQVVKDEPFHFKPKGDSTYLVTRRRK